MAKEVKPYKIKTTYISNKSNNIALLLFIFFGSFGVHRFYVGRITSAVVYLVTTLLILLFFGIVLETIAKFILGCCLFVDFVNILGKKFTDNAGRILI